MYFLGHRNFYRNVWKRRQILAIGTISIFLDNSQIIENLRLIFMRVKIFGNQRKRKRKFSITSLAIFFCSVNFFRLNFSCVFWVFESIREMIQLWHFEWIRDDPHRPTMGDITRLIEFLVWSRTFYVDEKTYK